MNKTQIDPAKINLAERDIEDWLYENPVSVDFCNGEYVFRWFARQYKVPSGIIDLLGLDSEGNFVVVEVKNTTIEADALTQVCRYAYDIQFVANELIDLIDLTEYPYIKKVVIGKEPILNSIQYEADALDITLLTFSVQLILGIDGPWSWTNEKSDSILDEYKKMQDDHVFAILKKAYAEGKRKDFLDHAEEIVIKAAQELDNEEGENE